MKHFSHHTFIHTLSHYCEDTLTVVALFVFFLFVLVAVVGPCCAPYDAFDMAFTPLAKPSLAHWFGVNDAGMDIFSELLSAIRNTLLFSLGAALPALALAFLVGVYAALNPGIVGRLLLRLADVMLAIPSIMLLILVGALFHPPLMLMALIYSLFIWAGAAKLINAQALPIVQSEHCRLARQMGASKHYIVRTHILPELYPLLLVLGAGRLRAAMLMEASLAYLGLGDPVAKSLGSMINFGLNYYYLDVWFNWLMPAIGALSLLVLSITLLAIRAESFADSRFNTAL